MQGIIGEGVDLNLEHLGDVRPSTRAVPPHARACSTPSGAIRARSRSCTSSASSSASPSSGSTAASSARAAPIRRSSCIRSWPTWPANASRPASRVQFRANVRSRRCSIRTTPSARRRTSASTRRRLDRWETELRPLPHQLGDPRQRLGSRVLPRGRGASEGACLREEPQPRA